MVSGEVKIADEKLRDYEMVFIISPQVKSEEVDAVIAKVGQFITGKGGTISGIERWGKRRLAYPIKHFVEGDYVFSRFKLKAAAANEVEANLGISEEILRHLLIISGS